MTSSPIPIQDCDKWDTGHIVGTSADEQLARDAISLMDNPYEFMLYAYDWGRGELSQFPDGPVGWQKEHAIEWGKHLQANQFDGVHAVTPWRSAVGSGHGIGKSCEVGMASDFIRTTRPNSKGVVTANTSKQLETKTWAEIIKWKKRSRYGHWFEHVNLKLYHPLNPENWRLDGLTCAEENSDSFAGGHNIESTMYYLVDEGSSVPDIIYEVIMGGMTDGEPMCLVRGNRTKNTGYFNKLFTTDLGRRWNTRVEDSRDFPYTNKAEIAEWAREYGEDSDFFRVRVRGLPPTQDENSLIAMGDVEKAMQAGHVLDVQPYVPLVLGVDCGGRLRDDTVLAPRRGPDARTIPWEIYSDLGEKDHHMQVAARIGEFSMRYAPDAIFIDAGGVGAAVIDRCRQLGLENIIPVHFGANLDQDSPYLNQRARIWSLMADHMREGMMLPISFGRTKKIADRIQQEMIVQTYTTTATFRRALTPKEIIRNRLGMSTDCGDALACTYAAPIGPRRNTSPIVPSLSNVKVLGGNDEPDWYRPGGGS